MPIPPPYNLSLMGNSTGYVTLMQEVNSTLMAGYFGIFILITLFIMTTMGFLQSTGSFLKAITASSFIAFALSFLLRAIDLVPDIAVYATMGLTAFTVAISFISDWYHKMRLLTRAYILPMLLTLSQGIKPLLFLITKPWGEEKGNKNV